MKKKEYITCEELMKDAMHKAKMAQRGYKKSEKYKSIDSNLVMYEIEQRKADQNYGEAAGIHQSLVLLGFDHDSMDELLELLQELQD